VGAVQGDAIFDEALMIRDTLRAWGYQSEMYGESISPDLEREVRPYHQYRPGYGHGDVLIFHYSIGSEVSNWVYSLARRVKLVLVYHNVTPAHYFAGVNEQVRKQAERGRRELPRFKDQACLALGVSEFNRQELLKAGYARTGVLPLFLDETLYEQPPDPETMALFDDAYVNLLFVGRVVPNKRQEDVIKAFYHYRQLNPHSRLFLVGSWGLMERYVEWLRGFVRYLKLEDVHFCGHVPFSQLSAYYRLADVFVSMSEHEGFCKPLLESMYFGLPIVAYATAGVTDTLGDTGILIKEKRYEVVAELIYLLMAKADFREAVVARQKERLEQFSSARAMKMLRSYLEKLLGDREISPIRK
jgi:glycosyltransferase involved in cell wall biosynthesis